MRERARAAESPPIPPPDTITGCRSPGEGRMRIVYLVAGTAGGIGALKPTERSTYSAIIDRPPLRFPRGIRLVVWPILNVEVWEIERAMPRQVLTAPTGASLLPDRSEEHTSELQSPCNLVCRLLLEKKKSVGSIMTIRVRTTLVGDAPASASAVATLAMHRAACASASSSHLPSGYHVAVPQTRTRPP